MMTLLAVGKIFYSDFGLFYQVTQNSGAIFSTTIRSILMCTRALTQMGEFGMLRRWAYTVCRRIYPGSCGESGSEKAEPRRRDVLGGMSDEEEALSCVGNCGQRHSLPGVLLLRSARAAPGVSSFTDNDTVFKNGNSFFPEKWSLGAYEYLVTQSETITRAYGISIFITLVGTVAGLLFTAMFGYALSRKIIRGRRGLNFYVFFTLLFNGGMVPTYLMYDNTFTSRIRCGRC